MFARSVHSTFIARDAGALTLVAVAAPSRSPLVGSEEAHADFAPGQVSSVDRDGDGFAKDLAIAYGLDPDNRDTDGDRLLDGGDLYDRSVYADPLDADTDNDRLTGGDWVSDRDEISYGRTPLDVDV